MSGNHHHRWVLRAVTGLLTGPSNSPCFCMNYHRHWVPRRDFTAWDTGTFLSRSSEGPLPWDLGRASPTSCPTSCLVPWHLRPSPPGPGHCIAGAPPRDESLCHPRLTLKLHFNEMKNNTYFLENLI